MEGEGEAGAVRVLDVRDLPVEAVELEPVVAHLRGDGVVAYPTETVYGMGTRCSEAGVARLARMKGRDPTKPFILLVADTSWVEGLAWTPAARELARVFWPGALTLVLADPEGVFPGAVHGPGGGVAVRVSPHPLVRRILEALDAPLTSTSVNRPGESPARSGSEAVAVARALAGGAEGAAGTAQADETAAQGKEAILVLDAGTLPPSGPSTIVDCTRPEPRVLREGTVPVGRLRCLLPELDGC
ncbi:MAG: L-threonylcarbamoyladenylate synthase [Gemmatimonadota bacterium]